SGDALASMLQSAGSQSQKAGTIAAIIGIVTLLITASGAFGEIQSSLNKIWKAEPKAGLSRLVRARAASLGLVMTRGFLMLVSLGKSLIGLYIGSSNVAESYGTAGSLIIILLWIYYSTLTFLFGAEFTRAYAQQFGSHAAQSGAGTVPREAEAARTPARSPEP